MCDPVRGKNVAEWLNFLATGSLQPTEKNTSKNIPEIEKLLNIINYKYPSVKFMQIVDSGNQSFF
jgi:hypothetical protein